MRFRGRCKPSESSVSISKLKFEFLANSSLNSIKIRLLKLTEFKFIKKERSGRFGEVRLQLCCSARKIYLVGIKCLLQV